jgi:GNAT superfamily N-acetyltransferase
MLTPRIGHIDDRHFIADCILACARSGGFAVNHELAEDVRNLHGEVDAILTDRRTARGMPAQPLVYCHDKIPVGFAIVAACSGDPLDLELYAMAVEHAHRGKGYGTIMLDDVLANFNYRHIYARCSPSSKTMHRMLEKRAFGTIDTNEQGFSIMLRHRPDNRAGVSKHNA